MGLVLCYLCLGRGRLQPAQSHTEAHVRPADPQASKQHVSVRVCLVQTGKVQVMNEGNKKNKSPQWEEVGNGRMVRS